MVNLKLEFVVLWHVMVHGNGKFVCLPMLFGMEKREMRGSKASDFTELN
jgi:hypothetical protein